MLGPMTTQEALALARLRLWARDRCAIANGRTAEYRNPGHPKPAANSARYDAVIVRALDFEKALAALPAPSRVALILTYRDGERYERTAATLHCSPRKLCSMIPTARRQLADALQRLNLL